MDGPLDLGRRGSVWLPGPILAGLAANQMSLPPILVTAHSKYLASHPARNIVIQGNTDERGGREYNLALGQKRADAVRKGMAAMGVSESQVEVVSFGKEKPKAGGHDEAA